MKTRSSRLALAVALALGAASAGKAQLRPTEITATQSTQLPYRESGKLTVKFTPNYYFGTSTSIRRYTGVTAGHLLYDPTAGLATNLLFQPGFFNGTDSASEGVASFAVLSGYQAAAGVDPNSDSAFSMDMGYIILKAPAPNNEWAAWTDDPTLLARGTNFLILGYAAQTHPGNQLASVTTNIPYSDDVGEEYQNTSFYTEEGMSGGPVYVTLDGSTAIEAVNVAGTDYSQSAESAARAISADERPLFIDAEYTTGCITGGVIDGPSTVQRGASAVFKVGVVFKDGATEGVNFPRSYDELVLKPAASIKASVTVEKVKTGKFRVTFPAKIPKGTQALFKLFRDTATNKEQRALATLTVTVQ
jgi:V8-like Glu-specific endopeptidase